VARKKEDMWQKIALAMGCSIDEVEAMHWEMGEVDLANRAGIMPFSQLQRSSGVAWDKANSRKSREQQRDPERFPEGN
jgi:hypothetical protein